MMITYEMIWIFWIAPLWGCVIGLWLVNQDGVVDALDTVIDWITDRLMWPTISSGPSPDFLEWLAEKGWMPDPSTDWPVPKPPRPWWRFW